MSTKKAFPAYLIAQATLRLARLLCLLLAGTFGSAHAFDLSLRTSSPEGTFANIQRSTAGTGLVFETRFNYVLTPNTPPPSGMLDIYFGGRVPSGQYFSWVDDEAKPGTLKLAAGFVPVQRGLSFEGPSPLPIVTDWSRRAEHRFGPNDALGSYFLFAIVVLAGDDPTNPDKWVNHDSLYLLLRP